LTPPWEQNLYPEEDEIHNFGRHLPALHRNAFRFSYIHVVSEKKVFLKKLVNFDTFYSTPWAPGGRKPEIHNLCPLVPKMHHIKFKRIWSSGYQEVKNVQILSDTIYHV
jgi:hypothetical protein